MSVHQRIRFRNRLIAAAPWVADFALHMRYALLMFNVRKHGWSIPPFSLVKRAMLRREALRIHAASFVETGTYLADTTWYLRRDFKQIFTIEVEPNLAAVARDRFKRWPHVRIVEGDSGDQLAAVVAQVVSPTLFWLDGHYSAGITGRGETDCPIWKELDAIVARADLKHSIFIDDARCFGDDPAYPTLEEMRDWCARKLPRHTFGVENDIIKMSAP